MEQLENYSLLSWQDAAIHLDAEYANIFALYSAGSAKTAIQASELPIN